MFKNSASTLSGSQSFSNLSRTTFGDNEQDEASDFVRRANHSKSGRISSTSLGRQVGINRSSIGLGEDSGDLEENTADDDDDEDDEDNDDDGDGDGNDDDLGYDEYDEEIDDIDVIPFDEDRPMGQSFGHQSLGPSRIIEPPQFLLTLFDMLETTQAILDPLDVVGVALASDDDNMIGKHVISESQKASHLQTIAQRLLSSLGNYAATLNNERLDQARKLAEILLNIYFPPPIDASSPARRPVSYTLVKWLNDNNQNPDTNYIVTVLQHKPDPSVHPDFWSLIHKLVLRCKFGDVKVLITSAKWNTTTPADPTVRFHTSAVASQLQRVSKMIADVIDQCPASPFLLGPKGEPNTSKSHRRGGQPYDDQWDTSSLPWRLWRSKVARLVDDMTRISQTSSTASRGSSQLSDDSTGLFRSRKTINQSSEVDVSLIPYDIAQQIRIILQIFLGDQETILNTGDTWMEALVGLAAYHDETGASGDGMELDVERWHPHDHKLHTGYRQEPTKRISRFFKLVTENIFPVPAVGGFESAIADIISRRIPKALKYLARLSLPVAAAIAEIFAWANLFPAELDAPDIAPGAGENQLSGKKDGEGLPINVKDDILSQYALALCDVDFIQNESEAPKEGWEIGLATLQRTNTVHTREVAAKLISKVLLSVDNIQRAERLVSMCELYGLLEERRCVAKSFAQQLLGAGEVGSALRYFSKADCSLEVHNVMASYVHDSLRSGKAVPTDADLDDALRDILTSPDALVEDEILRREMSGFAALRNYFLYVNSGLISEAARTLSILLLSAGEQIDGGVLQPGWTSVMVPLNIAGLVHEFLYGNKTVGDSKTMLGHLDHSSIFEVLGVIESLFIVGGETLEAIQTEFAETVTYQRSSPNHDFADSVLQLRKSTSQAIGRNWLKQETARSELAL